MPLGALPPTTSAASSPQSALVVGPPQLADALGLAIDAPLDHRVKDPWSVDAGDPTFEVERTDDNTTAIDLARALAPDLIVVDVDRPAARALVEALVTDPMIEQVPVLVVGSFARPEDAAPFVAMGVARALAKPVSPDALRRAAAEITATYVRGETSRSPLGETTLDALGEKLAEELRRGLCDAALTKSRGVRFDLGEGSDVLAALWGAVARIRDLVTIHSSGDVRFSASGPEGALPLAPGLGELAADPAGARVRMPPNARSGELGDVQGKTIVVADDDAAITWFLAGVLRAAGAHVVEAHDGARALEAAFRHAPDLVISDVLMPNVDGFALCRALRRDLVLRDVPVILLSWKEDLLQRVRELGADADGYLKKEASAVAIVQRVREVLRGRQRVAERIAAGGEVRGRLEGLTTRTLLSITCAHRPESTLEVRDACFLYDVAIRGGAPMRATRTAPDGTFQRGSSVLAALLGVGAGRFVVSPVESGAASIRPDLGGTLGEQLLGPIATARAAQRLLSGASLVAVERVEIDGERMAAYADASPEPARALLQTLGAGASPRALITSGQAAPRLVEDVLCDAAARGAIVAVLGVEGEDLLFEAATREAKVLRGERRVDPVVIPPLDLGPVMATATPGPVAMIADGPSRARPSRARARARAACPTSRHHRGSDRRLGAGAEAAARARRRASCRCRAMTTTEIASQPQVAKPVLATLGSLTPPPVMPEPRSAPPPAPRLSPPAPPGVQSTQRPSMYAPHAHEVAPPVRAPKAKDSRGMWIHFAVAGIVFAVGARLSRERQEPAAVQSADPTAAVTATGRRRRAPERADASAGAERRRRHHQVDADPPARRAAQARRQRSARAGHARGRGRLERHRLHRGHARRKRSGRAPRPRPAQGALRNPRRSPRRGAGSVRRDSARAPDARADRAALAALSERPRLGAHARSVVRPADGRQGLVNAPRAAIVVVLDRASSRRRSDAATAASTRGASFRRRPPRRRRARRRSPRASSRRSLLSSRTATSTIAAWSSTPGRRRWRRATAGRARCRKA